MKQENIENLDSLVLYLLFVIELYEVESQSITCIHQLLHQLRIPFCPFTFLQEAVH